MDEKPGKGKIAGMALAVVLASGLMAWALISAFQADQARFDGYDDTYGADYEPPLDSEADLPATDLAAEEADPAKPGDAAKTPAQPAQKKQETKAAPAKP